MRRGQATAARTAALRELAAWVRRYNDELFGGLLRPASLDLDDTVRLGAYHPAERRLSLSWPMICKEPWGVVLEVLKHELAHQYVVEVLGVTHETAHGPTFRRVCAERGIDARAAGTPGVEEEADTRVLQRVRKLLALAASPEEHEARSAMRAANRLMLRHNLDQVQADAPRAFVFEHLGPTRGRTPKHERILAGILGKHFFVQAIWVFGYDVARQRRGRVLEVIGTHENVAIAGYVHDYVLQTGERLWRRHREAQRLSGDRHRRRYLEGLMLGWWDQLEGETAAQQAEGLVWLGDPALADWVSRRFPSGARRRSVSVPADGFTRAGREAGRKLVVRRPIRGPTVSRGRAIAGPDGG